MVVMTMAPMAAKGKSRAVAGSTIIRITIDDSRPLVVVIRLIIAVVRVAVMSVIVVPSVVPVSMIAALILCLCRRSEQQTGQAHRRNENNFGCNHIVAFK